MGTFKIFMPVMIFSRNRLLLTLLFAFSLVSIKAYSSPHPATGSSALVSPEKGLFFQRYGFLLKTDQSGWILAPPTDLITYLNPQSESGSLSVRVETLRQEMTLENYAKRWTKDYPNYGFDVLGTRAFGLGKAKGLVIDLDHKKMGQQLRQILFLKDKKVVLLTCKDAAAKFEATLKGCNQISKSFEWTETTPQKSF